MKYKEHSYINHSSQGSHKIYYNDWGPEDGEPLICVHGLTGNGFDFDYLADDLSQKDRRIIAVDLPGRGRSDFLKDPLDYNYDQYILDLHALLSHLNLKNQASVDWLGVSLGGLLGLRIAALENSPIKRLILNDIGPSVPQAALGFIHQIISQVYIFDTIADLEQRMRMTRGLTWGPLTDEQWSHMARHNARALEDGRITYAYDHRISKVFEKTPIGDFDLWTCWDAVNCPLLVIQGGQSMLLTHDIIKQMEQRGPDFDLVVFEDCGHVPSLMAQTHIEIVKQWLNTSPI